MKLKIITLLTLVNLTFCTDKNQKEFNVIEIMEKDVLINDWKIPENPTLSNLSTKFNIKKETDPNTNSERIFFENGLEILLDKEKYFISGFKINYDLNKNKIFYIGSVKINQLEISRFTSPDQIKQYFNCRGIFCGMEFNKVYVSFTMNLDKSKINSIQIHL